MKFHIHPKIFVIQAIRIVVILCLALGMSGIFTSGCSRFQGQPPSLSGSSPTTPVPLKSDAKCNRCKGYLLPGMSLPSPRTVYRIDSDLPELFYTNGLLYSTRDVLPPFQTKNGEDVPEEMRRQHNAGFEGVDDSFEVFLYHLSQKHSPGETRRIVVYVKNIGSTGAVIRPRQAVFHGPNAGRPGSVESLLGEAVLLEKWEPPAPPIELTPGKGAIIGFTRQLGADLENSDATRAVFVTGILRADATGDGGAKPKLEINVVSIPGRVDREKWTEETEKWLNVGAQSGEGAMDLRIAPPECHVRRVVGVARNVLWQNEPITLDVNALPDERIPFQMAMFQVQSQGCEQARQSADLLLYPGYVHPDSIGNYMMEYSICINLINGGTTSKRVDLEFGKDDAPIGLAWQLAVGNQPTPLDGLKDLPVHIDWAGKGREGGGAPYYSKSMLESGPIEIQPGQSRSINLRLMVLGTSSLPYQLHLVTR